MSSTPSGYSAYKRRLRITVNGKPYLVEIDELTASPPSGYSAITVTVNGRPYMVNIETTEVEPVLASPRGPGTVPADEPAAVPQRVTRQTSAPGKAASSQANEIRAPMPGNILDITVKPGDKVSIRQQLCSLEAMKMKNAIHSPQDGVIASVEVTEGQAVAYGDVLFTFAPATPSGYSAGK
jgi:biotin carboxyl carrier protein